MRRLGDFKDLPVVLAGGVLNGRLPAGESSQNDFRLLLNVNTLEERGCARLPGWVAWRTLDDSNEDLHDQLIGAQGKMVDGDFVAADGQTEVLTLLAEARASSGIHYNIAGNKSRLYVSTGKGRNWRLIADGLGGPYSQTDSLWPNVRTQMAQVGDYLLFTNNIDPVFAWPMGGPVITTGDNADRLWAAFDVPDLVGLSLDRVGVIAAWDGWAFAGDVTEAGTRYPGRVYWSDFNNPISWAPGGESIAGYAPLGSGETVLRIEPIGGQLRCYTDKAIYAVTFVGGDAVFQFTEIYRGDLALAFQNSLINLGDTHIWMVQDSIVALGAFDRVPNRYEWMHRAAGFIFKGLDGRVVQDSPVDFSAFNPIDKTKCYQISTGYDANLGNIWISWPTKPTSDDPESPDDVFDFEGVRRMTMILNPRYQKATLVDYGFSAFSILRRHQWETVRDFMVENGVCSAENLITESSLVGQKEGFPMNTQTSPDTLPTCIWNEDEDPNNPKSENSVAAMVCDRKLAIDCKQCVPEPEFAMVSVLDFCIKRFDISARLREVYLSKQTTVWVPNKNLNHFPNVLQAFYGEFGYPTLIQGEISRWGTGSDKIVTKILAAYDAEEQTVSGKLGAQIGVSNSPHCTDWHSADAVTMDCLRSGADADGARASQPALFNFYRAGAWVAYRLFVASMEDDVLNYSPTGCGVTINDIAIRAKSKNETWSNQ